MYIYDDKGARKLTLNLDDGTKEMQAEIVPKIDSNFITVIIEGGKVEHNLNDAVEEDGKQVGTQLFIFTKKMSKICLTFFCLYDIIWKNKRME